MAVPQQRDPARTLERLASWFGERDPRCTVTSVSVPGSGFSTETLIVDLRRAGAGERLVIRVAPTVHRVYPWDRFAEQVEVLRVLDKESDLPVPGLRDYEPDPSVLGAPFLVQDWVDGRVPSDYPSYHRQGWVAELPEPARRRLWFAGVDMLARIHLLPLGSVGAGLLDAGGAWRTSTARHLDRYAGQLGFFGCADDEVVSTALDWLRTHDPGDPVEPGLVWGDARIGNLIFDGTTPVAVLDWEMAAIGQPEVDLAWYLYLDRNLSEGIGVPRLTGWPDRAETLAYYERRLGRPVRDLGYYEVFAGFRFALVTARVTRLAVDRRMVPPGTDFPLHRNAVALLARTLAETTALPGQDRAR
ncbi:phosphotransferase family protein [Amycolatopsis sp. WAC 04197]|nr:phosphotransferase family protein [Amycolatopsis sp. WAC 04197]